MHADVAGSAICSWHWCLHMPARSICNIEYDKFGQFEQNSVIDKDS